MAIVVRFFAAAAMGCSIFLSTAVGAKAMAAGSALKTVCVGHFLVDVPANSEVRISGTYRAISAERIKGSTSFDEMKTSLDGKASRLKAAAMKRDAGGDALDRKFDVDPEKSYAKTQLIDLQYDRGTQASIGYHDKASSDRFTVEIHRLIDEEHYQFTTQNIGADKYPLVRESVARAADRYTPLRGGILPSQPGFCVGNGLFREDNVQDIGGDATLVVRFREYPNVTFTVDVSGLKQRAKESPLQDRVDGDLALLSRFSSKVRTLRRGKADYADQSGYEIDISASSEDPPGGRMQKFFWGAEGIPKDNLHPLIEAQLIAGESGRSTLTDDEAEALWSGLMKSMRIR